MLLGITTLFVAISISVIAAYYSIIGLTAIFAAAFLPIVLMGSVLEVGKLLATVWLHQNWNRAPKVIRAYLVTAVIVLMFITSMGVFGFLSKSHVQQAALGDEQVAQVESINEKMIRAQAKISRWTEDIERLNKGETSGRVDALIIREQKRITDARANLKPQIDAENNKVPGLREQAAIEIGQQNKRLTDAQNRSASDIKIAQDQLAQLDKDVAAYTKGGVKVGTFSDTDLVGKGAELRKQQKPERDKLQADITKAKSNEIGVAGRVQREIRNINKRLAESINKVELRIADIRKTIQPTIDSANTNIAKYTSDAGNQNKNIDVKIKELEILIENEQPVIDKLREDRFVFEKKYRAFEAEVGPVKYIAELVYGEADRNLLEAAVRWVIIIIVAVFDPLAICLILAATMTIGWAQEDKKARREEEQLTDETFTTADVELVKELEMKLEQHNDILTELEKLLDDNLGKMDPAEYAKLKNEHEKLGGERDEMEQALQAAIDQISNLEASEKDNLAKLSGLTASLTQFEERIEELLAKIANLEAEVERRDKVVEGLASKYHLVEKDSFGDDLIADAGPPPEDDNDDLLSILDDNVTEVADQKKSQQ